MVFWIKVHDAQGVPGNIQSVQVTHPDDAVEDLQLWADNPYNPATATSAVYMAISSKPPVDGTYTFTVRDNDNHSDMVTEILTVDPLGIPSDASLLPANNATIGRYRR